MSWWGDGYHQANMQISIRFIWPTNFLTDSQWRPLQLFSELWRNLDGNGCWGLGRSPLIQNAITATGLKKEWRMQRLWENTVKLQMPFFAIWLASGATELCIGKAGPGPRQTETCSAWLQMEWIRVNICCPGGQGAELPNQLKVTLMSVSTFNFIILKYHGNPSYQPKATRTSNKGLL